MVQVYDPSTDSWSTPVTVGKMTPRSELSSAVVDNKVYVMGGYIPDGDVGIVEVFDPNGTSGVNAVSASSEVLLSLSPDPITSNTTISFTLPEASVATLTLTDAAGRETLLLPLDLLDAGQHEVTWDASNYPSGVYLCRLSACGVSVTRRVVVLH